ncbi:MAG: hypothetical protein RIC29_03825 [Rhodospirillaceae bacterium]
MASQSKDPSGNQRAPKVDHSLDSASKQVHPDPAVDDVGASGSTARGSGHTPRHGIAEVVEESKNLKKDPSIEKAGSQPHKDTAGDDVGSGGATHR